MTRTILPAAIAVLLACLTLPLGAQDDSSRAHAPQPTVPAITEGDLRTRLFIFADDSMQGREAGTAGHLRSTDYLAAELRALGLEPAGDSGTYFQTVPLARRALDEASGVSVAGRSLAFWTDVVPVRGGVATEVTPVFAGSLHDSSGWIGREAVRGRLVVFHATRGPLSLPPMSEGARFEQAAAVGIVVPPQLLQAYGNFLRRPQLALRQEQTGTTTPVLLLSAAAAEALLGGPVDRCARTLRTPRPSFLHAT
jgi:hypothetical protein